MGKTIDYQPIKDLMLAHLKRNFAHGKIFSIRDFRSIEYDHGAPHHRIKRALAILVEEQRIEPVGSFIGAHGDSPIATYKLNNPKEPKIHTQYCKARITKIKLREAYMTQAALRLAKAMGMPA